MATVGSLVVEVATNVARLQSDIAKMRKSFDSLNNRVGKTNAAVAGLSKAFVALTASAGGLLTIRKAWDLAFDAAKFKQAQEGFANLARTNGRFADQMIDDLRRLSAGTISTAGIMQSAGKAMLLGIPAQQMDEMMKIARASARITGDSVQKAFEDIAVGVGRQSKLILDNLGIIVNANKAYEDYAKSIDKTAKNLSDAEKKQAFMNAAMKAGRKIVEDVGANTVSAAENMQRFKANIDELAIALGEKLLPALNTSIEYFNELIGISLIDPEKKRLNTINAINDAIEFQRNLRDDLQRRLKTFEISGRTRLDAEEAIKKANSEILRLTLLIYDIDRKRTKELKDQQELAEKAAARKRDEAEREIAEEFISNLELEREKTEKLAEAQRNLEEATRSLFESQQNFSLNVPQLTREDLNGDFKNMLDERLSHYQGYFSDLTGLFRDLSKVEIEEALKTNEFKIAIAQSALSVAASTMQNIISVTKSGGRTYFEIMKAFAAGEAVIQTFRAAQSAKAALSVIPVIGPALGKAAYAAELIAGAATVRKILSTKPGDSSVSGVSGGGGGGGVGALPNEGFPGFEPRQSQQIIINIQSLDPSSVNWDRLMEDNIAPALERLSGKNGRNVNLDINILER